MTDAEAKRDVIGLSCVRVSDIETNALERRGQRYRRGSLIPNTGTAKHNRTTASSKYRRAEEKPQAILQPCVVCAFFVPNVNCYERMSTGVHLRGGEPVADLKKGRSLMISTLPKYVLFPCSYRRIYAGGDNLH